MEENQKICKIMTEFTLYLLERDVTGINIKLKKTNKKVSIIVECDMIADEFINEIEFSFKHKRQEALELYGWELLGCGDTENDLELASSLINYLSYYKIDNKIKFELVRYED